MDEETFVFLDFFEKIKKFPGVNIDDFKNKLLQIWGSGTKKYKKYKFLIEFIDKNYNFVIRLFKKKKRRRVLFYALKCPALLQALRKSKKYDVIIGALTLQDRIYAIKKLMEYVSFTDLGTPIFGYIKTNNKNNVSLLIKKTKKKLLKLKPKIIILWNDSLPLERAIIYVARDLGIITVDIQHGIYNSDIKPTDGGIANYLLVWGKFFEELYLKYKFKIPEDIYIVGYPYKIKHIKEKHNKRVYYLGQDFDRLNKSLLKVKIETINKLSNICKKLGLEFIYRPHPSDDIKLLKKYLKVKFSSKKEKLENVFSKGTIFISFSSTSLVEAAIYGKICIQLRNYPLKRDNFEKLGICKTFDNFHDLEKYLKRIVESNFKKDVTPFNRNYIYIPKDPGKRFLEILSKIEERERL